MQNLNDEWITQIGFVAEKLISTATNTVRKIVTKIKFILLDREFNLYLLAVYDFSILA